MHYVYILQSQVSGRFYIGCTNNLTKRLKQHNAGQNRSTSLNRPWQLVCFKGFSSGKEAYQNEKLVKSYKHGEAFKRIINGEVAEWSKAAHC